MKNLKMAVTGVTLLTLGILHTTVANAITFKITGNVTDITLPNGVVQQDGSIVPGGLIEGIFDTNNSHVVFNVGNYRFTEEPNGGFTQFFLSNSELDSFRTINIVQTNNLLYPLDPQREFGYSIARLSYSTIFATRTDLLIAGHSFDGYNDGEPDFMINGSVVSINRVPEPTFSFSLLALGTLGAASALKRKHKLKS